MLYSGPYKRGRPMTFAKSAIVVVFFGAIFATSPLLANETSTDPAVQALKDSRWAQPEAQPKPTPGADKPASQPKSTVTAICTDASGRTLKEGESGYQTCLSQVSAGAN